MSNQLGQNIQLLIQNTIENMKLTDYKVGIVIQLKPEIKIKLDETKTITDINTNFIYTELMIKKVIVDGKEIYIKNIEENDKLLLLRVAKGQKFIVISKLYEVKGKI